MFLEDLPEAAAKLKACPAKGDAVVWAARGIRGAISYAVSSFIYNSGGNFSGSDGKPSLCSANSVKGAELYANMLKDYGPLALQTIHLPKSLKCWGRANLL